VTVGFERIVEVAMMSYSLEVLDLV